MKNDLYLTYQFFGREVVVSYLLKQYLKTECPSALPETILQRFVCITSLFSTLFLLSSHPHSPDPVLLINNLSLYFSVSVMAHQLSHDESKHITWHRNYIFRISHTIGLIRWTVSWGPEIKPRWAYVKDWESRCAEGEYGRGWGWQSRVTGSKVDGCPLILNHNFCVS